MALSRRPHTRQRPMTKECQPFHCPSTGRAESSRGPEGVAASAINDTWCRDTGAGRSFALGYARDECNDPYVCDLPHTLGEPASFPTGIEEGHTRKEVVAMFAGATSGGHWVVKIAMSSGASICTRTSPPVITPPSPRWAR
jgi:hypothetical protein